MEESKAQIKYRWNVNSKKWDFWDRSSASTWDHGWYQVPENELENIPTDVKNRCKLLIQREMMKSTSKNNVKKKNYENAPKIPTDYVYNMIHLYLLTNNFPHKSSRLKIVNRLFDQTNKLTFNNIKTLSNPEKTEFDDYVISDFFIDFSSTYLPILIVDYNYQNGFIKILSEISQYLMESKDFAEDDVLTPYKEFKRDVYRLVFPEKILSEKTDLDELDKYDVDNLFKSNSQMQIDLMKIFYIPKKKGKKSKITWEQINEIKASYDEMSNEQKDILHQMEILENVIVKHKDNMALWVKKQLLSMKNELQEKINLLFISNQQTNQAGSSSAAHKFECNEEHFAQEICEVLNYTNPVHIAALIENFHDINAKHMNNVDNPLYAILQDVKVHIDKIELKKEHKNILLAFLYGSSDKKIVSNMLNMETEKLMRTLKTTISKKVAYYFQNNVGK